MTLATTFSPVFSRRVTIYQWFSGLFAEELSEVQFTTYQSGEANKWLATFEQIGLDDESLRLQKAIAEWQKKGLDSLDLRADFTELFLLDKQTAAIPYASFYLEEGGQLYGEMEAKMRYFLAENQLQMQADFKEPSDHISVFLALIQQWTINALETKNIEAVIPEQFDFLQEALLSWLPKFVQRCQSVSLESDFYPALAELLLAFILLDSEFLRDAKVQL